MILRAPFDVMDHLMQHTVLGGRMKDASFFGRADGGVQTKNPLSLIAVLGGPTETVRLKQAEHMIYQISRYHTHTMQCLEGLRETVEIQADGDL
jgi:hypothetical protein